MQNKEIQVLSEVLLDGTILETVYDVTTGETSLVVDRNGRYETVPSYKDPVTNIEYKPYQDDDGLIKSKFVKLASTAIPYESIQQLYQQIRDLIAEHMKLPEGFLSVSAIYVMSTWVYDRFHAMPYLRVVGNFGSGKSRFEQLMAGLCYKSMHAGGSISTAAVFRTLNLIQGTLVFDETDFKSSEMHSDIIKILNSGHSKDVPVVRMNVKKEGMTTQTFVVYGPKVLASRERFKDEALESRCLTQTLLPIKTNKPVHLPPEFATQALVLRNKLLSFRLDNFHKIEADESTLGSIEFPRLKQSALAVTSIASLISKDVLAEILHFLENYEKELQTMQKTDIKADVLLCILELVAEWDQKSPHKIYIGQIAERFERKFYGDYSNHKDQYYESHSEGVITSRNYAVSPKQIGRYVRDLCIRTEHGGDGWSIRLPQAFEVINLQAERFGFEKPWEIPNGQKKIPVDDNPDTEIKAEDIPF